MNIKNIDEGNEFYVQKIKFGFESRQSPQGSDAWESLDLERQ